MKLKMYLSSGLSVLFLFLSCVEKSKVGNEHVDYSEMSTVLIPTNEESVCVDDLIVDGSFVRLGPTGDLLIGGISNIYFTEDRIIVADNRKAQAVFIFNREGENLAVINRMGRGPQEYIGISHATLTPDKKNIAIHDNFGRKVLFYDLSGQFVSSQPVGFNWMTMEYMDDDHVVCAAYGLGKEDTGLASLPDFNRLIYYTDRDFQIQESAFPNRYHAQSQSCTPHLAKFRDTVYINPSYCDTIYQATSQGLKARYWLDMRAVDGISNLDSTVTNEMLDQYIKDRVLFPGIFADAPDFAFFKMMAPGQWCRVVYSKKTGKSYRLLPHSTQGDNIFFLQSEAVDGDQFVSAVPAYQILMLGSSDESKKAQPDLYDGLTDESNPVLFFYTLKEPE